MKLQRRAITSPAAFFCRTHQVRQNGQSDGMPGAISSANEAQGTRLNYVGVGDACTVQQRRPYSGNGNLQHLVPDLPYMALEPVVADEGMSVMCV